MSTSNTWSDMLIALILDFLLWLPIRNTELCRGNEDEHTAALRQSPFAY